MHKSGHVRKLAGLTILLAVLFALAVVLVSCGDGNQNAAGTTEESPRLPPGMTEEELEEGVTAQDIESSGEGLESSEKEDAQAAETQEAGNETSQESTDLSPKSSADLAGARFTVVEALRVDTNQGVLRSGQREVIGDYLEVELTVENIGDDLVDLTQYSFRLESPGIDADEYSSYYGVDGTYGKYVSEHVISAVLLDYTALMPVAYKLKIGETLDDVFLFFDLNPLSTARNEGFTKDNANNDTNLVIRKVRGNDSGEEIELSLAGYPD